MMVAASDIMSDFRNRKSITVFAVPFGIVGLEGARFGGQVLVAAQKFKYLTCDSRSRYTGSSGAVMGLSRVLTSSGYSDSWYSTNQRAGVLYLITLAAPVVRSTAVCLGFTYVEKQVLMTETTIIIISLTSAHFRPRLETLPGRLPARSMPARGPFANRTATLGHSR